MMASFASWQESLRQELRKANSIFQKFGFTSSGNVLGANFRAYGRSFGVFDFSEFVEHARGFYADALARRGEQGYTILILPNGMKAIDLRGEVRGVFDKDGNPIAYFRPNYRVLGYATPQEEINDFKQGIFAAQATIN